MVGVTGGWNLMDETTAKIAAIGLLTATQDAEVVKKFASQTGYKVDDTLNLTGGYLDQTNSFTSDRETSVIIGDVDGTSSPIVLSVVGGSNYLSVSKNNANIVQNAGSTVTINSGNVAGVVGGSLTVLSLHDISYISFNGEGTGAEEATRTQLFTSIESTALNIGGKANVGGFVAGHAGIATNGSKIDSEVKNGTTVNIKFNDEGLDPLDGLVVGGVAGNVVVATGKSEAKATTNGQTIVNIHNGEVMGIVGGGAAVSFDMGGTLGFLLGSGSGSATTQSDSVIMNVGAKSATAALMGGGIAVADANGKNNGSASSTAKFVELNFEGPKALNENDKVKLHNAATTYLPKFREDIKSQNFSQLVADFTGFADQVDIPGVHVANLGGGSAIARGYFVDDEATGTATANSKVDSVSMTFNGGYNVATAAGGLAVAHDKADASKAANQTNATANVDKVNLIITGGENILFTAGGLAYSTAEKRDGASLAKATANVGSAEVLVSGGTIDGLLGGGIAFDNVNGKATNAVANTESVTIEVTGGEINAANVDPITKPIQGEHAGVPSRGSHVHQVAKTLGKDGANVAILGGGVASGAGAESTIQNVKLLLNGGKVNDNVFAGGLATLGGKATVEKALVQVNGAEVTGNIYGGGVAGSYQNEAFDADYKKASSNVKETTISLVKGSLNGNVYAGGLNIEKSTSSKSTVDTAVVEIGSDFSKVAAAAEVALLDADQTAQKKIIIRSFDKLDSGDLVTGANYDMGGKSNVVVTGNYEFGEILNVADTKMMTVKEGGALAVQSAAAPTNKFVVEEGVLALGTTARTSDARDGLGKYNEKAGLYLSGQVNLANASINVGETKAKNGVNIGSNGKLIVDASVDDGQEDNLSTDVTGKITGEKGSTIHYVHVADKGVVKVEHEGFTTVTVDNLLYKVVKVENEDNQYTFKIATGSELAGTGLEHFDGAALDGMADNEVIGSLLDQANTAITSGSQREARLNGALNLAAAGGVQTAGIEAATMGIDQATKRATLTNVFLDGWTGFAEVTGTSLKMGGDSGALETKTELGGITVGGEYTMGDMTFGVMGNFGTGDVEGEGDNDGVKNDVDYYGVQGYAAKRMGQFNLVGQMGLMTTKNDVTSADGDSADIDATIFTIGARGEMAFQLSKSCQAVPYVGLNYLRVATDGYNTTKGLSVDDMDQNLVSMPIGVAFSGNMDLASGWTLHPTVDVAYVHTFGDTDVEATTKFGDAAINTNLDVWSENVGRVSFGLEARKDALSFGGQIGGAFGDNDHREFYGQLNVKYLF